jgi:hypothetical protein
MRATEKNVVRVLASVLAKHYRCACEPKKTFPWLPAATRARRIAVDAYFGPPLNLIFEFDEDRHFTRWRARTLEQYPADVPLSFDVRFYRERCGRRRARAAAGAKARAERDALVDLLPPAHGLNPTLRIAQAELVDNPRQDLQRIELERRLAKLLDERVAFRANTTFLHMLRHPSAKPWLPTVGK